MLLTARTLVCFLLAASPCLDVASSQMRRYMRQTQLLKAPDERKQRLRGQDNQPPQFSDKSYSAEVYETAAEGAMVVAVMAQDADSDQISYYISQPGNQEFKMFSINPQTGVIRLVSRAFTFDQEHYYFDAVAVDSEQQTDTAAVHVRVIDVNNHRPQFPDCGDYHPQVEENKPVGTHVITVKATDADKGANAELVYSLVTSPSLPESLFNIDKDTGELTTRRKFNRDAPDHEKELRVIVKASDKGTPSLEGTCPFTVTVLDVNDNSPLFDRASYIESVAVDAAQGDTVGRVSATDEDVGPNGAITYSLVAETPAQEGYFSVDARTGILTLVQTLDQFNIDDQLALVATATDQGEAPREAQVPVLITVKDSSTRPPSFTQLPPPVVTLPENYRDTETPVASLQAVSNLADSAKVYYDLERGSQEQTNKFSTFVIEPDGAGGATVRYGGSRQLDYEQVTAYNLTVIASTEENTRAEATFTVRLTDQNDVVPIFYDADKVTIAENAAPGTFVTFAEAVDGDRTAPNNVVTYRLDPKTPEHELFAIDAETGRLATLVQFDREDEKHASPFYTVTVIAEDGAPSDIRHTGEPNRARQRFTVEIGDVNDNPPQFDAGGVFSASIQENADKGSKVIDIVATDRDVDSKIMYQITGGNRDAAFNMDADTGVITVKNKIDYEAVPNYTLIVTASDGLYEASHPVQIQVINVNDEPPIFDQPAYTQQLLEGYSSSKPILRVHAYDPDPLGDDDTIVYKLSGPGIYPDRPEDNVFSILDSGEIIVRKPLDHDEGTGGHPEWDLTVLAWDASGTGSAVPFTLTLNDTNDNPPYLVLNTGVIPENLSDFKDFAIPVEADDFDDHDRNGPPYTFALDTRAPATLRNKFEVRTVTSPANGDNSAEIRPRVVFDREQQKQYVLPIVVADNAAATPRRLTGTSLFTVVIGDKNDNDMRPGASRIQVFNFEGQMPATVIGRVFVEDPDDWDLPDKTFSWRDGGRTQHFQLDKDTGNITMKYGTPNGTYPLKFTVYDKKFDSTVHADVTIVVRKLPRVAVERSGSIRFKNITAEQFIDSPSKDESSLYSRLGPELARLLDVPTEQVDVFSVQNNARGGVDVRYAAHNSPYYRAERLDGIVQLHAKQLEETLKLEMEQVGINPCVFESTCEGSCYSWLQIHDDQVATVYTNRSSLAGVLTTVEHSCGVCEDQGPLICLNGGTRINTLPPRCECEPGFSGPRCEGLTLHFTGNGYSWFPGLSACNVSTLRFDLTSSDASGLVLYNGPVAPPVTGVQDFLAVDVLAGRLRLFLNYGTGTAVASPQTRVDDGRRHHVDVDWDVYGIRIRVDSCTGLQSCQASAAAPSTSGHTNGFLNVAAPLQLGGSAVPLERVARHMAWVDTPVSRGFAGCLENVTFLERTFDLSNPAFGVNYTSHCAAPAEAVIYASSGFLAIVLCLLLFVVVLLLIAYVARRRVMARHKGALSRQNSKELHLITSMEDAGDQSDGGKARVDASTQQSAAPTAAPDDDAATDVMAPRPFDDVIVNDAADWPQDDVRNYAFEGSGSSAGSLSSLNSGTTNGDQEFDYLRDWGPGFRRLADLYASPDDEEEVQLAAGPGGESWC